MDVRKLQYTNMLNLDNKIIIVTGGSGLLGRAIIENLLQYNAKVINFDIHSQSDKCEFMKCDITNDQSIIVSIKNVQNRYGKIDGFVNNAYPRTKDWGKTSFELISSESLRKNVDWQLNSYFICCQEVIKKMLVNKFGSIVNVASIYGVVGNDFTLYENTEIHPPAAYSAIKAGIINLTRYLASKYGKDGIRVNSVSPGGIFDKQPENFVNNYIIRVPLKRMGTPEDIAPGIAFLLSDEAKYITGHNLVIDGGYTII